MKATLINQAAFRVITSRSEHFPEGNREAFQAIESHLASLRGRKFFGLVSESDDGLIYDAGLVPQDDCEERRFVDLGFSVREIDGGVCARIKMRDWLSKTDQIGALFGSMIAEYGIDRTRPQMEFYRSLTELHLLLPVPS